MKAKFWPICWLTLFVLIAVGIVVFLAVLIKRKPECFSNFYLLIIIIVAALGALVFLSFFIKQKKDNFYLHKNASVFYIPPVYERDILTHFHLPNNREKNFYGYNLSITVFEGKFVVISRISDHEMKSRDRQCRTYDLNESIELPSDINRYFNMFNGSRGISGLITWDLETPTKIKLVSPHISEEQLCTIQYPGFEDPRLFLYHGEPWVICYFRGKNLNNDLGCSHKVVVFPMRSPDSLIVLKYSKGGNWEKNWLPFENNKKVYVVYSFSPHVILEVDMKTGICTEAFSTPVTNEPVFRYHDGVGGGTPPVLITDKFYIAAAHTRAEGPTVRKNFFYLFESSPPFSVQAVSPEINLDSNYKNIEFVSGLIVMKDLVIVSAGIDDCYSRIVAYNKKTILDFIFKRTVKKGYNGSDKKEKFTKLQRQLCPQLLENTVEFVESLSIPYWLTAGTLLGTIREGDIIKNDTDLDIAIPKKYSPLFRWAIKNGGHENFDLKCDRQVKRLVSFVLKNNKGAYIDVYDYMEIDDMELVQARLMNRLYYVPKNSEKLLECMYGNWKIPSGKHATLEDMEKCTKKLGVIEDFEQKKTKLLVSQADRDLLYNMMYVLHQLLEANHITYWIMGGAAIAAVREKTLIAWDDDIDICIFRDEIPKLYALDSSLRNYGYRLDKRGEIIRCNRITEKYPYIDIFEVCLKGNTYFLCPPHGSKAQWLNQLWKLSELFPLKYYSVGPLQLLGPKDIKSYLERGYKDYKTPHYWKPHHSGKPLHSKTGTVYFQGNKHTSLNNLICLAGFSLVFEPSLASILISRDSKFLKRYEKDRICLELEDKNPGNWKLLSKSGRSFSSRQPEIIAKFRKFIDEFTN